MQINRTSVKELLGHITGSEHKVIVKDLERILQQAVYQKGKDKKLDITKPSKILAKKRNRGVVYYRYYTSEWKGFVVIELLLKSSFIAI